MSLTVQSAEVAEVLIGGEWFTVADRSFSVDSYEFQPKDKRRNPTPGREAGFSFLAANGRRMAGPLESIEAFVYQP